MIIAVFTAIFVVLSGAGRWLVTEDAMQHADAVVVFGGQVPFRAMEAAAIYRNGWAPEVWLTQGGVHPEDIALERLGIEATPEHEYSRRVLERVGVPDRAIHVVPGRNQNTAEEVQAVARELKLRGYARTILVTSKFHSRRVKYLWHHLTGNRPAAIVRYTADDPFQPDIWWRNTEDAMAVSREWFGILNAWARFPVKSER